MESADFMDFSFSSSDLWGAYYGSDSAFTLEMGNINGIFLNLIPLKKLDKT